MKTTRAPQRIGFVLCSNSAYPLPSTRIATLNVMPRLKQAGWDPVILLEPETPTETPDLGGLYERSIQSGCTVVVFQKVRGPQAVELASTLEAAGVRTVFLVCDVVDPSMVAVTSATVAVTKFLRSLYPEYLQTRIHVVHDGIEAPDERKTNWGEGCGTRLRPLTASLVTSAELNQLPQIVHPPVWLRVRIVGRYATGRQHLKHIRRAFLAMHGSAKLAYLQFLLNRRIQCVPWHPTGVYGELHCADIGLLPVNTDSTAQTLSWQVKSENRLTLKMSMALPVIATPIPSYEDVIEHGVTGLLARSRADWARCLESLRDPAYRKSMGAAAREAVRLRFSVDEQTKLLIEVLRIVSQPQVVVSKQGSPDSPD